MGNSLVPCSKEKIIKGSNIPPKTTISADWLIVPGWDLRCLPPGTLLGTLCAHDGVGKSAQLVRHVPLVAAMTELFQDRFLVGVGGCQEVSVGWKKCFYFFVGNNWPNGPKSNYKQYLCFLYLMLLFWKFVTMYTCCDISV